MNKLCSKCNIEKPLSEFHKNSLGKFGVHSICKVCCVEKKRLDRLNNPLKYSSRASSYYKTHKDDILRKCKKYRQNNPDKIKQLESSPQRKLAHTIRQRIRNTIFRKYRNSKSLELVGCNLDNLKLYLESKFQEGMNWDNHGFGDDRWHIDHIIPCDSFDLTKEEEQKKCFHFTNLQPLWQHDNLSKSNKIF